MPDREAAADRLLSVFEPGDMAFHSHEDTFDRPEGSVLLATGEHVKLQARRRGEAAWGLRFHIEVDAAEVELWLQGAGDGLKEAWGTSADEIRGEVARYLATQEAKAREVFRRFAAVIRAAPRTTAAR